MTNFAKTVFTFLIALVAPAILFAQTGGWIEYPYTPFGTGSMIHGIGDNCLGVTYQNADKILFFDINTALWTELEFNSVQHFNAILAEGNLAFAFSDTFIVAFNAATANWDTLRYEGEPLSVTGYEIRLSYQCGANLAMFVTDEKMYIFDVAIDSWQEFDYTMPADYIGDDHFWIKDNYAAAILTCDEGTPPTNLAYSFITQNYRETARGIQWYEDISEMDYGFAGRYYDEDDPERYYAGYSSLSNQFQVENCESDYTLYPPTGTVNEDYVDEFTVYTGKARKAVPGDTIIIKLCGYDTRLGNWADSTIGLSWGAYEPALWKIGGRFGCSQLRNQDNSLRLFFYSGISGDIYSIDPGMPYNAANYCHLGGVVYSIRDEYNAWGHNVETGDSSSIPIVRNQHVNLMAGREFCTFDRINPLSDTSTVYFYHGPTNSWQTYDILGVLRNFAGGANVFAFNVMEGDLSVSFYSPYQNEMTRVAFPAVNPFQAANHNIAVGYSPGQTTIFDARTGAIHTNGCQFDIDGLGDNVVITRNLDNGTYYGYSARSGLVTEYPADGILYINEAFDYIGVANTNGQIFYTFNAFHDTWIEIDPVGDDAWVYVGGKTALLRADDILYAFDPEAPQTDIDDNTVSPLPQSFSLAQNYPNPFNARTIINYNLPTSSDVTIDIYDLLGRKITTLVDKKQQAGSHQAVWNGEGISSGIYFYKIQAGDFVETKKMLLVK
ncbi:MAG: T9SS type A sorting domain-containing protein [candidate division Zixibacteria bacterium]|nr:T9SS type A sorting domain-containing protein [candidate division Zixibacteria bacterium]